MLVFELSDSGLESSCRHLKNCAVIHEIKPSYVGFTGLELSKWLMYDFHYNFFKKHFDAELLFTDTGSLTYKTISEDVMKNFLTTKTCSILVTIRKIQSFLIRPIKKLLAK